jgi:protein tyrosine/serine phosphatase
MEALEEPTPVVSLTDRYCLLATYAREQIGRVITAVAEAETPIVYHCAAGKDRTGIVSAILLGLLRVTEETIVADYVASRQNLDAIVERLMTTEGYTTMLAALPAGTLHAEPTTMVEFLERLRGRYGSMSAYAHAAGVSGVTVERLLERLLES